MKNNLLKLRLHKEFSPIMFDIYAAAPDCNTTINWLDLNKTLVIHIIHSTEGKPLLYSVWHNYLFCHFSIIFQICMWLSTIHFGHQIKLPFSFCTPPHSQRQSSPQFKPIIQYRSKVCTQSARGANFYVKSVSVHQGCASRRAKGRSENLEGEGVSTK